MCATVGLGQQGCKGGGVQKIKQNLNFKCLRYSKFVICLKLGIQGSTTALVQNTKSNISIFLV